MVIKKVIQKDSKREKLIVVYLVVFLDQEDQNQKVLVIAGLKVERREIIEIEKHLIINDCYDCILLNFIEF